MKTVDEDCLVWQGAKNKAGYGKESKPGGGWKLAHRMAWERRYGPIPLGLFVCHHCDNPGCIRLSHLFLGTAKDNHEDMMKKGRHHSSKITHCPYGHPYEGDNLWISRLNGRTCLICAKARSKKSRQTNPEVAERSRASNREYHRVHAEKIRARKRAAWQAKKLARKTSITDPS